MSKEQKPERLTPKTARNIAFTVHKHRYYDCREVDDILDALLELIDSQEEEKQAIDRKLREYEANIAGIMLECEKIRARASDENNQPEIPFDAPENYDE